MKKLLTIAIEANGRYCNDGCQWKRAPVLSGMDMTCGLFREALHWDYRKKTNGHSRLAECRKAEVKS